jgi:hypothetical protein
MTSDRYKGAYRYVLVETFEPESTSGRHGSVHVRPVAGQVFSQSLFVSCSRELTDTSKFPLGTKFKLLAKLTDREGGGEYLYSNHRDAPLPLSSSQAKAFLAGLRRGEA